MPRIMVVEDDSRFAQGARSYFLGRRDVQVVYAFDMDSALKELYAAPPVRGALIDCFFPKKTGSGDITLGKEMVGKMATSDPRERRIVAGLSLLGSYVDIEDPDMRKYARLWIAATDNISESPVLRAINQIGILGREAATLIAKNSLGMAYREGQDRDYYGALAKAMEESEANQPLGLMVADQAQTVDVPFVLVTSTYHHDTLTQPVQNFASERGWELVDCAKDRPDEKAAPEFWERAFARLEHTMQRT